MDRDLRGPGLPLDEWPTAERAGIRGLLDNGGGSVSSRTACCRSQETSRPRDGLARDARRRLEARLGRRGAAAGAHSRRGGAPERHVPGPPLRQLGRAPCIWGTAPRPPGDDRSGGDTLITLAGRADWDPAAAANLDRLGGEHQFHWTRTPRSKLAGDRKGSRQRRSSSTHVQSCGVA